MASNPRRLGYGDFEPELIADPHHWISRYTACWRFLDVVRSLYPKVLEDLACFPLERASELGHEGEMIQWVREWAMRHRLRSDLILGVAVWTLAEWARNPEARQARRWEFGHVTWRIPDTQLQPVFPDPLTEDCAAWRKKCDRLWLERVQELKAVGHSRTLLKDAQHYEWLAQFVVGTKTFGQIRISAGVDSIQTVANAAHRLANMIELRLSARRGDRKSIKK